MRYPRADRPDSSICSRARTELFYQRGWCGGVVVISDVETNDVALWWPRADGAAIHLP